MHVHNASAEIVFPVNQKKYSYISYHEIIVFGECIHQGYATNWIFCPLKYDLHKILPQLPTTNGPFY